MTYSWMTAPWDREGEEKANHSQGVVLTEPEVESAMKELYHTELTSNFPRVEKFLQDPIYNNQVFGLVSFVPTKGATPDEKGCFGFLKYRGCFQTELEADQRAEFIIRNVDSYHEIYTTYIGRPTPLFKDMKKMVKEVNEIDIRKEAVNTFSEDLKEKRRKEQKDIQEIKEREQRLLDESKEDFYDKNPEEKYTTLHVKRANLVHTYIETMKKLDVMRENIIKTRKEIQEMDESDPELRKEYFQRYMDARKSSGLDDFSAEDVDKLKGTFMQYLYEDADLGF